MAPVTVVELDETQRLVAEGDAADRQIVIAGPGSGKTEVVAARVAVLALDHDVDPTGELLVISFSRAAVRAVTRRLRDSDVRATAAVRTLDALAAQVVAECGEDPAGMSFDRRVERAGCLVRDGAWEAIRDLRHLVVDEVQDVVGSRAELLRAVVDGLPDGCGFTLLGDPAQAIYDFQLDARSDLTSGEMLERIGGLPGVIRRSLTGSYRARTREARAAVQLRAGVAADLSDAHLRVRDFTDTIVDVGTLDALEPLLADTTQSTAVLTETNGQALVVAHMLWELGVSAVVRRPSRVPVIDQWVATALADRATWTREEFLDTQPDEDLGAARWKALRTVARPRGGSIDTTALAARLTRPWALPGEIVGADETGVVVSTIHRAKGLEFDNVVLVQFEQHRDRDEDPDATARRTYVAVTRAHARLFRVRLGGWYRLHRDRSDRWFAPNRQGKGTVRYEVRGEDVDRSVPPGAPELGAAQRSLAAAVRHGEPLSMELDDSSTLRLPVYRLLHGDVVVGRTGRQFGETFAGQVGTADRRKRESVAWPRFGAVHVETVETVAGEPQRTTGTVGKHGLWLGVRAVGMPWLEWKVDG